jgi:pimeloyl-ACP methyl ester carboxylesterase
VLAQTDFGGLLDQIRVPVLIATGEEDAGSNPRMARYMHERIIGSELHILPGMRHSILTEAPEQVAALMRGFLGIAPESRHDRRGTGLSHPQRAGGALSSAGAR